MEYILIFIVGGVGGFLVAWVWFSNKLKEMQEMKQEAGRVEREVKREREIWYGFSEFNEKMGKVKEERKQKIMDELKRVGKTQTNAVADLLDISRATAFRYLEELEKEGVIEQVGKTGREVEYRAKQTLQP